VILQPDECADYGIVVEMGVLEFTRATIISPNVVAASSSKPRARRISSRSAA